MRLSDEIRIVLAPERTFGALASARAESSWPRACAPVLLTSLVLGVALSTAATHVASITGALSAAVFWSFVPAVQLGTAWTACRRAPAPAVGRARAFELFFLGHAPWSLWLLAYAAGTFWFQAGPGFLNVLVVGVLVPAVLTPIIIAAFCRTVLGCSVSAARKRTAIHQAITWLVVAILALVADQSWVRYGGGA